MAREIDLSEAASLAEQPLADAERRRPHFSRDGAFALEQLQRT
jgi:hypothetical protein